MATVDIDLLNYVGEDLTGTFKLRNMTMRNKHKEEVKKYNNNNNNKKKKKKE